MLLDGGNDAWPRFWGRLQPTLENWVRSPGFLGRISAREDYCRDIVILAWEKLQDNDYNKLRAYFRRHVDATSRGPSASSYRAFGAWLFRVFKNIGIDYMRRLPEYVRPRNRTRSGSGKKDTSESESGAHWQALVTLQGDEEPVERSFTSSMTARQLLEFLDTSIPSRQRRAALLYQQGASYDRIGREIGLADHRDAQRVVQRSVDRLKYRRAVELWSQNYSSTEIAQELALQDPQHARRIVKAAQEFLKRHFRP